MSEPTPALATRRVKRGGAPEARTSATERTAETPERTDTSTCPECEAQTRFDEAHGETVCTECGVVVDEAQVDHGPEWRAFTPSERDEKSRVGAPTTERLHDRGLSSTIGWQNSDAQGRRFSAEKRRKFQRLRTWDERFRSKNAHERNVKQALGEIDRMAAALGLPENVRETASVVYRRAVEQDLLPGRSIEGMATASLYAAARQAGLPRTLDEFATVSRVEQQRFARDYRYLSRELGLAIEPASPTDYLPRFASELGVEAETVRHARHLLETAIEQGRHSGKNPAGLAAAAIYASALLDNDRIPQRVISEVARISEVTIRKRYQELLEAAEQESGPT